MFKSGFYKMIAFYCENEQEKALAQAIADELNNALRLNAKDLIKVAPMLRKNQSVIKEIFKKLGSGASIMSIVPLAMKIKP